MIANIRTLYKQVHKKRDFIEYAAASFNLKPTSLRNHWFGNFWQIPSSKQGDVVKIMQNWIKNQK